jgi:hypothetical protein
MPSRRLVKALSWEETAAVFLACWDIVYRAIQWAVYCGIAHLELNGIKSISIKVSARLVYQGESIRKRPNKGNVQHARAYSDALELVSFRGCAD